MLKRAHALLAIAAAFQIFDGIQAIATGVLRGVADTRTPVITNVVGHWLFGLPYEKIEPVIHPRVTRCTTATTRGP